MYSTFRFAFEFTPNLLPICTIDVIKGRWNGSMEMETFDESNVPNSNKQLTKYTFVDFRIQQSIYIYLYFLFA